MLRKSDKKIDEYMVNQNVRGWTLTGDGNRSYGYVSSQLAESFHSAACHARQLHPVAMIEELISMTEDWIMKHQITYGKLHNDGIKLPSHVRKHIDNMTIEAADYVFKSVGVQTNDNIVIQGHVQHKDATNWHATCVVVRDEDSSHPESAIVVDESSQSMCTCGYQTVYSLPCKHQIALLLHKEKIHHACDLVDPLLTVKTGCTMFNQAGTPGLYATVDLSSATPMTLPNVRRPPGRPRRKRIKSNTMPESGNSGNNKKARLCSLCHRSGHNRRKCVTPRVLTSSTCVYTATQSIQTTESS